MPQHIKVGIKKYSEGLIVYESPQFPQANSLIRICTSPMMQVIDDIVNIENLKTRFSGLCVHQNRFEVKDTVPAMMMIARQVKAICLSQQNAQQKAGIGEKAMFMPMPAKSKLRDILYISVSRYVYFRSFDISSETLCYNSGKCFLRVMQKGQAMMVPKNRTFRYLTGDYCFPLHFQVILECTRKALRQVPTPD